MTSFLLALCIYVTKVNILFYNATLREVIEGKYGRYYLLEISH